MAAGTGRDHVTTSWSAEAIATYTGMSWRRAKEGIDNLRKAKVIVKQYGKKSRPRYRLRKPRKKLWIPMTFIFGAESETPPIARVRQIQDADTTFLAFSLYGAQDLVEHEGLPSTMLQRKYQSCALMASGECEVMGFSVKEKPSCLKGSYPIPYGDPWSHLTPLFDVGVIEWVPYLTEGDDGEFIHALSGDDLAIEVASHLASFGEYVRTYFGYGFKSEWIIPVRRHRKRVAVIDIARMRYRPPLTRMTRQWWFKHALTLDEYRQFYREKTELIQRVAA
jgi:hypothetical protein